MSRRRTHRPPELFVQIPVDFADSASVDKARTVLGLSTHEALGVFLLLFTATLKARCGGRIMTRSDAWIEEAARWRGTPGAFAAFVREHLADDDDPAVLRGYLQRYGELEAKWAKDAERQRNRRRGLTSSAAPDADDDDVREESADSPRTVGGQSVDCPDSPSSSSSSSGSSVRREEPSTTPGESAERGDDADESEAAAPLLAVREFDLAQFGKRRRYVEGLLRSARFPDAVAAVLRDLMDPEVTRDPYTADEVGRAVVEYLNSSDRAPGTFAAVHFEAFVRRVRRRLVSRDRENGHDRHTQREVRLEREAVAARERAAREEQDAEQLVRRFREEQPDDYARIAAEVEREAAKVPEGTIREQFAQGALRSRVAAAVQQRRAPSRPGGAHVAVA